MSSRFSREVKKAPRSRNIEDRRFGAARRKSDMEMVDKVPSHQIPGALGRAAERVERMKGSYRPNRSSRWREVYYGD